MTGEVQMAVDLSVLKSSLLAIVEGNRQVFAELIQQHGYTPALETAAGTHPVLVDLKERFNREVIAGLMGFTLTVHPEPGIEVGGEVVKVMLKETNSEKGAELFVITRGYDALSTVNEFRIPLEALDTIGLIVVSPKGSRKLN